MKLSTSIQLRFRRETAAFFALVVFFFLCICGFIEILASKPWFFNIVPYPSPSIDSTFPELDVKFQRLWKYGKPDCLFLGSSMTDTGLYPAVFEEMVYENTGTQYHCFNIGFSSSMVEVSSAVATSLTNWYKVDLIIWGISPIDMDPLLADTRPIADMPVFQYNNGNPNLTGFLYNHFRLPWFLASLPHLQNKEYTGVLRDFDNRLDAQGMRRSDLKEPLNLDKVMLPDFEMNPDDLNAFQKTIKNFKQSGKKIIIVEMPVHPKFLPYLVTGGAASYQKDFIEPIQRYLESESVPFIRSQDDISTIIDMKTSWGNESHLNTDGAILFTRYIAKSCAALDIFP
jgi:hypothetical protein